MCAKEAEQVWRPAHALSHAQLQGARLSAKVGLWNLICSLRFSTKNKEKETCAERGRESKSIQNCGKPFLSTTITTEIGLNTVCWNGSLWFLYESTIVFPPIQDQTNYIYNINILCIYKPKAGVLCGHLLHFNVFLLGLAHMPVDFSVQVKHLSCRPSNLSAVDHHQVSHAFWIPLHLLMHFQFRNSSRRRQRDWKKCTSSSGQGGTAQACLRAFRICGFFRKDPYRPIGCDLNILNYFWQLQCMWSYCNAIMSFDCQSSASVVFAVAQADSKQRISLLSFVLGIILHNKI